MERILCGGIYVSTCWGITSITPYSYLLIILTFFLLAFPSPFLSSFSGNSPQLQRRSTTHLGVIRNQPERERGRGNPFSNLRRTQSSLTSRNQRPHSMEVDRSTLQGPTQPSDSSGRALTSGSRLAAPPLIQGGGKSEAEGTGCGSGTKNKRMVASSGTAESSPSPRSACKEHHLLEMVSTNSNSNNERDSHSVTTPTSLNSDTDSIKTSGSERTLVEGSSSAALPLQRDLLNLPPTKHKHTSSSLDSEGLGSLTSEEIGMEEPDWAQWSKEVREAVVGYIEKKAQLCSCVMATNVHCMCTHCQKFVKLIANV